MEKYVSHCIETTCSCLQATNSTEAGCHCQALLGFVSQCTAADSSVDLSTWRVQHNCRECIHSSTFPSQSVVIFVMNK